MDSIFIEGKTWFDKTYGNSYFSARIEVNGKVVGWLPFQYGYGSQYRHEAMRWLKSNGYAELVESAEAYPRQNKVAVYSTIAEAKLREVKAWGKAWEVAA